MAAPVIYFLRLRGPGEVWRFSSSRQPPTQQVIFEILYSQLHCFGDTYIVFGTVDILVISQPKWLKFGVQAHLFKMIGHTKFQLSIFCTFKVMKLLVEVKVEQNFDKNWKNSNFLQISDVIWVFQSRVVSPFMQEIWVGLFSDFH